MRCKYCNVLLEEYDKGICRYCGKDNHVVGNIIESSTHEHIKSEDFIKSNDSITNELTKYYIGENYENIVKGGFSFGCLFFGWLYLFYRKFWKLAIIILFINFFFPMFLPFSFIVNIILAFVFKKEYMKYVNTRIMQIRNQNPNASFEDLKILCKNEGGTVKLLRSFFVIVSILILLVIIYLFCKLAESGSIDYFIEDFLDMFNM